MLQLITLDWSSRTDIWLRYADYVKGFSANSSHCMQRHNDNLVYKIAPFRRPPLPFVFLYSSLSCNNFFSHTHIFIIYRTFSCVFFSVLHFFSSIDQSQHILFGFILKTSVSPSRLLLAHLCFKGSTAACTHAYTHTSSSSAAPTSFFCIITNQHPHTQRTHTRSPHAICKG